MEILHTAEGVNKKIGLAAVFLFLTVFLYPRETFGANEYGECAYGNQSYQENCPAASAVAPQTGGGGGAWSDVASPPPPPGGFTLKAGSVNSQNEVELRFGFSGPITSIFISEHANFATSSFIGPASSTWWKIPTSKTLYVKYCTLANACSAPLSVEISAASSALPSTPSSVPAYKPDAFVFRLPLSRGMTHQDVAKLQEFLASYSDIYPEGEITGYFGSRTEEAVKRFQLKYGISSPSAGSVYGYVGPNTRAKLNELLAAKVSLPEASSLQPETTHELFSRSLVLKDKSEDVRRLQQFLNKHNFIVSASGDGSSGRETNYFGPATMRAVVKFQNFYANDILVPAGLSEGTGYFGPLSIKKANELLEKE